MSYYKYICCGLLCFCCIQFIQAQSSNSGKKSAFNLTGNIGASVNFFSSSDQFSIQPSHSWSTYGSLFGRINKIKLPASYVISQYSSSHSPAIVQMGISPTYQWAKLHIGYRYIRFSPLTFEGQSFRGAGIELNPKLFRFAAFYGKLNKAVNEDTSRGRYKLPRYTRLGYGMKVGIGNTFNYLDLIYFHAKDDSSSALLVRDSSKINYLRAQENSVVGTSFKLTLHKKLTITSDLAISGLIQDLSHNYKTLDPSNQSLRKFIGKFLPSNNSTLASYAGQSSLNYYTRFSNTNIGYRRVAPNFISLGTPYMYNDIELISGVNSVSLFKGKLNISTSLSQQHNNLNRKLLTQTQTQILNNNINATLGQHFNVNLNYSGYNIKQKNGTAQLSNTLLIRQKVSQLNFTPSYNVAKGNKIHFLSSNINLSNLKDENEVTAPQTNSKNLSTSLNYTLGFLKLPLNFSLSSMFNKYKQEVNVYKSYGGTVGTSVQFFKLRNLNVQGNFGYILNHFNGTNLKSDSKNFTYSASVGYNAKHHSFSLYANYVYTPPNAITSAINNITQYAVTSKYKSGGISYNYSF